MRPWHEEPGAREWRKAADTADLQRGTVVPADELPGLLRGVEELKLAIRLLTDPAGPQGTPGRSAVRRALTMIPQSKHDQICHETRWRGRERWDRHGAALEMCSRRTCGRCAPLRVEQERVRDDGSNCSTNPRGKS
jgi:hypothetical protein